jgi:hypothetical protein
VSRLIAVVFGTSSCKIEVLSARDAARAEADWGCRCRFKSIPAFTANLTMEMFQKQTQS